MHVQKRSFLVVSFFLMFFLLVPLQLFAKIDDKFISFSDKVIAVVNDDIITESELKQRVLLLKKMFRDQGKKIPSNQEMQNQVIEHLVIELLQKRQADALGLTISDFEFETIVQDLARERNLSLNQFKRSLALEGIFWETFQDYLRIEMANNRLKLHKFANKVSVTSEEINNFISKNYSEVDNTEYVYQKVKEHLFHEKMTKKVASYLSELLAQSYVEYRI